MGLLVLFVPLIIIFTVITIIKAVKHKENRSNRIFSVIALLILLVFLGRPYIGIMYTLINGISSGMAAGRRIPESKAQAMEEAVLYKDYFTELAEYELKSLTSEEKLPKGIYPQGEHREARDAIFSVLGFNNAYIADNRVIFEDAVDHTSGEWIVLEVVYYADGGPDDERYEKIGDKLYAGFFEVDENYFRYSTVPLAEITPETTESTESTLTEPSLQ